MQGSTIINPEKRTAVHKEIESRKAEITAAQREMNDIIKRTIQVFHNSCSIDGSVIFEMNRSLRNIDYMQDRIKELKEDSSKAPTEEELLGADIRYHQKLERRPTKYRSKVEKSMDAYVESNSDEIYLKKLIAKKNELMDQNKYLKFSIEQLLEKT